MNQINNSKIVVIGGAGLIGSHIIEELLKENVGEIIIFDDFTRGTHSNIENSLKDSRVKIFEDKADICNEAQLNRALKNSDYVFHLAALWLLHCYEYPREAFEVNIKGTFNVLEGCVQNKIKRLVYSSSASVYGDALEIPMKENHPYNNKTFYGATKIAGEHMAKAYHHRYGLNYVGLRYMNVYGARQDYKGAYIAVIMKFLDAIDKNEPLKIFGDGSQAFDFIYVEDVAKANICALKADTNDEFYNVGSGTQTTIKQLAELLLKITKSKVGIQNEPAGLTFVTNRIGDALKAKKELGFEYKIELEEGLRMLIQWREQHKKNL